MSGKAFKDFGKSENAVQGSLTFIRLIRCYSSEHFHNYTYQITQTVTAFWHPRLRQAAALSVS